MAKKTLILDYRVIVEEEQYEDGSMVYVTQVPTLGISDYGDTVEEALKNTRKLIKFHVESLSEEGETVPAPDRAERSFAVKNWWKIFSLFLISPKSLLPAHPRWNLAALPAP